MDFTKMEDSEKRAYLRATRMQVGLSQQDLAAKFGVDMGLVSCWENAKKTAFPVPDDVLDYVRRVKALHDLEVARRLDEMQDCYDTGEAEFTFWRSQVIYERAGMEGYAAIENGINLACATILEYGGVKVTWVYPPKPAIVAE